MREDLLTVSKAHEEYPEFSKQKINFAIRQGMLKAKKRGTSYYFTRIEWNNYLGIPNSSESLGKDLEIEKLKRELELAKHKINTLRNLISTCSGILS